MIGKVVHVGIDLALFSAFLAGVKRGTGLSVNLETIGNNDVKYYGGKYLDIGESLFDYSVAYFSSSDYFKRR